MDIKYLIKNINNCWGTTSGFLNFLKRLLWTYSARIPRYLCPDSLTIGFSYPDLGDKIKFNVRTNKADSFIFGEVYDHRFYNIPLFGKPSTILDLGANVGFVTIYYKLLYPEAEIACVEPIPWNVNQLNMNLKLNQIKAKVFASAVATFDGSVNMEIHDKDFGHKVVTKSSTKSFNICKVNAISINTVVKEMRWDVIDLLKIDIEGYERELFKSNLKWIEITKNICIEIHDDFGEIDLLRIKNKFGFTQLKSLPGLWLLSR